MSTSELRRGPGWWMDLEGQWNPPEEWPEDNPPLPGWTRGADGRWFDPQLHMNDVHETRDRSGIGESAPSSKQRPVPETSAIPSLESLSAPDMTSQLAAEATKKSAEPTVIVDRRTTERRSNPTPAQSALSFAEATADMSVTQAEDLRRRREGTMAALVAAVTASMLAAGLVLLLLLL